MQKVKLVILQTKSTGLGIFTTEPIGEGKVVFVFGGDEKWAWEIEDEKLERCLQVGIDRYIVPRTHSAGWYINHSCKPNCYVSGKNKIVAIRNIDAGEEVTIDYSFNLAWEGFSMRCKCNSLNCREVIKDYFSLPERIRVNGRKYASKYLKS
ncbi:MAG: SET domain-containing protein [Thaumarchaeota archaeon]|nr:SET domain-containing protein [Nitrososphaerota archaeon]